MDSNSSDNSTLPKWFELMQPVLESLKTLGGSGTRPEVVERVASDLGLSDEQLDEVTPKSQTSRFAGRVGWARFYLVTSGHIDSGTRGIWLLTEKGKEALLTSEDIKEISKNARKRKRAKSDGGSDVAPNPNDEDADPDEATVQSYVLKTLEILKKLSPAGFEQLSKRLLRESGFQKAEWPYGDS